MSIILSRMAEAYMTGQKELLEEYINTNDYGNVYYNDSINTNDYMGSDEQCADIKEKLNIFYEKLLAQQVDRALILKIKKIKDIINSEAECLTNFDIYLNIYKIILLIIDHIGINKNDIEITDHLYDRAVNGDYSIDSYINNQPEVEDKIGSFFNVIRTNDKREITNYINSLNKLIVSRTTSLYYDDGIYDDLPNEIEIVEE